LLPLDGHEHYSILEELVAPEGKITQALLRLANLVRSKTTA
jgi:hypothetical protein